MTFFVIFVLILLKNKNILFYEKTFLGDFL